MKRSNSPSEDKQTPGQEPGSKVTEDKAGRGGFRGRRYWLPALMISTLVIVLWWLIRPWLFVLAPAIVTSEPLEMRSPAAGMVNTVFHKRGDFVSSGDPLLELKDLTLDAQIQGLARQLAQMQQFRDLGAEISSQLGEKIRVAYEGVKRQDELLAQFETFRAKGVVPTADMAAVMQAHTAAKMALEQARAELIMEQQRQQESRQAGVVTQSRQRMELELSRLKALREQLTIRAPYDALVADIHVQVGEQLALERPLLWLSGRANPVVVTYLDPKYLDYVGLGQQATIRMPNGDSVSGRVAEPSELVSKLPKQLSGSFDGKKPVLKVTLTPDDTLPLAMEGVPVEVSFDRF
ncbi:HlyD family secretion protein [Shewanella sp.]|uniref:HlyD family secretion protein n=1 Tax=Shewanella sp. TaxID=50422 RepID=UPI00356215C1